jgi:hypothetical protein
MSEPTLVQVFGTGATQDATSFTIQKSALAAVGLTAYSTNTAESLLVALILLAALYLNTTNQEANTDIQITIEDSQYPQIVNRNSAQYRQVIYNVNLQTPEAEFTIDPDSY